MDEELKKIIEDLLEKTRDNITRPIFNDDNFDPQIAAEALMKEREGIIKIAEETRAALANYQPSNEDNLLMKCALDKFCIDHLSARNNQNIGKESLQETFEEHDGLNFYKTMHRIIHRSQKQWEDAFSEKNFLERVRDPEQRARLQEDCYIDILGQNLEEDEKQHKPPLDPSLMATKSTIIAK